MRKSRIKILLQIAGCTLFLLQPVLLPSSPANIDNPLFSRPLLKDFSANALIIAFFYFNYFVLIPKLYFNKKYFLYSFTVMLGLICIIGLPSLIPHGNFLQSENLRPPQPPFEHSMNHTDDSLFTRFRFFFTDIDNQVFLFASIVLFSLLLRIRSRWFQTEKAKKDAEIFFLQSQINPHFLFNALNSIYALTVKEKAAQSSESMLKLSGMMRYIVTETNTDFGPLEKEIAYIRDYIDLQKLRLDKSVKLNFKITGMLTGKKIAPLLLIPFIENAFKHGVNPDEDSEIDIVIDSHADFIQLDVENKKVTTQNRTDEHLGFGIANTKTRLALLYPDGHNLLINDSEIFYGAKLIIFFK